MGKSVETRSSPRKEELKCVLVGHKSIGFQWKFKRGDKIIATSKEYGDITKCRSAAADFVREVQKDNFSVYDLSK